MSHPSLNEPFAVATDHDVDATIGPGLRAPLRHTYGGDWRIPRAADTPYVYSNFVMSKDARISFGQPGKSTAAEVSGDNPYDRWLMALLRARADAVVVGDGILRQEPDYSPLADWVFPDSDGQFAAQRADDGARPRYLSVIVSMNADFPAEALADTRFDTLIATCDAGLDACHRLIKTAGATTATARSFGETSVAMGALTAALASDYDSRSILCEGGALVYGAMLTARTVTDEFLTISPIIVGPGTTAQVRRPSLVDGTAFTADDHPRSTLMSLRTAGDFLFLRSRYQW